MPSITSKSALAMFVVLATASLTAEAVEPSVASGQVDEFKYLGNYGVPTSGDRQSLIFTLEGAVLNQPCTGFYLNPDNKRGQSILLTAKAIKAEVKIEYYYQLKNEIDNHVACLVRSISVI